MESSNILKETVKRVEKEVRELLAEVRADRFDRGNLESKLKEVQSNLKVLDFHIDKRDIDKRDPT